jgi:pyruvate dehydrogenase E2 component (dihydrolipoamide acetyltransferase)
MPELQIKRSSKKTMADIVLMPQLGISEESAVLSQWYVKKGDRVKPGQKLFSLETGKASFDFESEYEGYVLELLCSEGDELPIKTPVCVIGEQGETYTPPETAVKPDEKSANPPETVQKTEAETVKAITNESNGTAISPRAKRLAEKAGITDFSGIAPTGPEGRIIERDVNQYLDSGRAAMVKPAQEKAAAPEYMDMPISRVRRIIAERMHSSLSEMAQLTINATFDAGALLAFRKSAKSGVIPGFDGVTINDLILFAVSRTILSFPDMNAHFLGDKIRRFNSVNLGFACDTEKGLVVPVIKNAQNLTLLEISAHAKALANVCKNGTIAPEDMENGTFTVSNLGSLGVTSFTPVINPPQTGILGVNTLETKVRLENGAPVYYTAMGLSLTFDHRALDGAPAARFLKALCDNLENFLLLLAK